MAKSYAPGAAQDRVGTTEACGAMLWRVDDWVIAGAGLSVARMTVRAGVTSPAHRHPNCNEVIVLRDGQVTCRIDGLEHCLAVGDAGFVPAGAVHAICNDALGDAVLLLTYNAGPRVYDAAGT